MSVAASLQGDTFVIHAHGGSVELSRFDANQIARSIIEQIDSCTVEGCYRPLAGGGLCMGHFQRVRRTGDVQADKPLLPFRGVTSKAAEAVRISAMPPSKRVASLSERIGQ